MRLLVVFVLVALVAAVVVARPAQDEDVKERLEDLLIRAIRQKGGAKGRKGGKGGKGGDKVLPRPKGTAGPGGKRPKVDHFMRALKYLSVVMAHMGPADPAHLKEGLPKVSGMLKATHEVLKHAVAASKANKDAPPEKAVQGIDSLGAELKKAGKMEGLSIVDVTKFMMQVMFNGLKGEKSCGTLFEGLMKVIKSKSPETSDPKAEKEVSDKLTAAAIADLECVEKTVGQVVAEVTDLEKNPPATGAELETKLSHIGVSMGKMARDIGGAAKGLYTLRMVLAHMIEEKKTEAVASRELMEELDTLLEKLSSKH